MGLLGGHGFELIIVLVVALLVFGPKKLPEMGSSIGKSITAFRKGMSEMGHKDDEQTDNSFDTQKSIESSRLELEAIERELAAKKAALSEKETEQPEPAAE